MSPQAVIDVGSNTIHLLVGEVENGAVLPVTGRSSRPVSGGVDKTGRIEERRIPLAAEAIKLFGMVAKMNGAPEPTVLATSAVRDAENGGELVEEVRRTSGLEMRLISGEEEADLGFRGAVSALGEGYVWEAPALVVDLGGGSAQLILGDATEGAQKQVSLPLGSNRTTERFSAGDRPNPKELKALRKAAREMLPDWKLSKRTAVVAIGGSARAVLKVTRDELTAEKLKKLAEELSGRPAAVLAREEGLTPERARVLPAAAATLAAILQRYEKPSLTVARGGIREGAILALAEEAGG
ncbi:Ppx/GppA phosphatase family protein [Rubrobacter marinus]|uniref:Ppx/GppA phosphatase family protein n=1 Tax=Rubrobacter marinus TaxID=2653852 RepID=UPI00140C0241|nr:hypothetical protein [Rubrobacter marinus]